MFLRAVHVRYVRRGVACACGEGKAMPKLGRLVRRLHAPVIICVETSSQWSMQESFYYAYMTLAGLEPAIPGSVGRCLIHWAKGPLANLNRL